MDVDELDLIYRIIIVGCGGVGKTSMLARYARGAWSGEYKKTIGVDYYEKRLYLDEDECDEVRLMLWDTAGQEEFGSLTSQYYRGASGAIIVFSTINRSSFDQVRDWVDHVHEFCDNIPMVLVQNKYDLKSQSTVTDKEVVERARSLHLPYFRSSVKDNVNINEAFLHLVNLIIRSGTSNDAAVSGIHDHALPSADTTSATPRGAETVPPAPAIPVLDIVPSDEEVMETFDESSQESEDPELEAMLREADEAAAAVEQVKEKGKGEAKAKAKAKAKGECGDVEEEDEQVVALRGKMIGEAEKPKSARLMELAQSEGRLKSSGSVSDRPRARGSSPASSYQQGASPATPSSSYQRAPRASGSMSSAGSSRTPRSSSMLRAQTPPAELVITPRASRWRKNAASVPPAMVASVSRPLPNLIPDAPELAPEPPPARSRTRLRKMGAADPDVVKLDAPHSGQARRKKHWWKCQI